jgi:dolichyl-diphosphooligosaccharide--protein glycosyltransferase
MEKLKSQKRYLDERPANFNNIYLFIFSLFITYAICVFLRLMEYPAWQAPYLQIGGEKLMATHDAYAWLAGAKGINRYAGASLAELVACISRCTGISPGNVGFWLPVFLAPLVVVPIVLLGLASGEIEATLVPAIMAGTGIGFLLRTRLGFLDTDVLTLFFPLFVGTGLTVWLSEVCRSTWKFENHESDEKRLFKFFPGAVLIGLLIKIYLWFYGSGSSIVLSLLGMAFILSLVLAYKQLRLHLLIGFLILYLVAYGGWIAFLVAVCFLVTVAGKPELFQQKKVLIVLFIIGAGLLFIDTHIFDQIRGMFYILLRWSKVSPSEMLNSTSLTLPSVIQSVREAQDINWTQLIVRVSGNWLLFAGGMVGLVYFAWKRPLMLIFLPLLGLAIASVKLGNRFTMYGGAVIGLGLGFGLNAMLFYFRQPLLRRILIHLVLAIFAIWPSFSIMKGLRPAPVLPSIYAQTFVELKNKADYKAQLWQWWDYGYAAQYYAERDTMGDGGRQEGPWLYPLAKVHTTSSPLQANQLIKLVATTLDSQNKELVSTDGIKAVLYQGDPVKFLENLGPRKAERYIISLAQEEKDWPSDLPPQYFVLSESLKNL